VATNLLSAVECKNATSKGWGSASSTMAMAFIFGSISMGGNTGGCGTGRLPRRSRSPLGSIPKFL
jgi:hypothetical protein